jgi:hypothetical protein
MKQKRAGVEYPGKLNIVTADGHFSGCCAIYFKSPKEMNAWAEENETLLMVKTEPDVKLGGMWGFFTKTLTDREREVLDRYGRALDEKVTEELEAELAEEEKRKGEAQKKQEQLMEMAGIGQRYAKRVKQIDTYASKATKKAALKELNSGVLPTMEEMTAAEAVEAANAQG